MSATIEIINLTKQYGRKTAVDNISLKVDQGDIFGFVGPNGAGKTSTIRMIAGLLQPTSGEIHISDHSVKREIQAVKRIIGYMPDFFGVYHGLKVWEYLDFFCACYDMPRSERPGIIDGLMELFELKGQREESVDKLSRGMKQRLSLARTLVHDPQVLILDEPAANLDPRARVEIRELMREMALMGKTIFFSTHILADAADICTRVGIIEAGRLVAVGGLEQLQKQLLFERRVEITLLGEMQLATELLEGIEEVAHILPQPARNAGKHDRLVITFKGDDASLGSLLAKLVSNGISVLHFSEDNRNLEQVFLRATKGLVA